MEQELKDLFKDGENPYEKWDSQINPTFFLWERLFLPISRLDDERLYSPEVLNFIRKNSILLEESVVINSPVQDEENAPMYFKDNSSYKFLYKDTVIILKENGQNYNITIYYATEKNDNLKDFSQFLFKTKGQSKVSIMLTKNGRLVINNLPFTAPVIDDLDLNYGSGFTENHEQIVSKLNEKNGKIFLFSGSPGSGKSTYIKYLSSIISREIIFLPVGFTNQLSSPDLLNLLLEHKEAVIVVEDAEQIIRSRSESDSSVISTILNMADGILGSLLNISFILTYNCEEKLIDEALLRKGRLAFKHVFGPLKLNDAKKLAKHLDLDDSKITEDTVLTNIYNLGDITESEESENIDKSNKKEMGFEAIRRQRESGDTP